jgi:hypothetical protein
MATKFNGEPACVRNRKTLFTYGHNGRLQKATSMVRSEGIISPVTFNAIARSEGIVPV